MWSSLNVDATRDCIHAFAQHALNASLNTSRLGLDSQIRIYPLYILCAFIPAYVNVFKCYLTTIQSLRTLVNGKEILQLPHYLNAQVISVFSVRYWPGGGLFLNISTLPASFRYGPWDCLQRERRGGEGHRGEVALIEKRGTKKKGGYGGAKKAEVVIKEEVKWEPHEQIFSSDAVRQSSLFKNRTVSVQSCLLFFF